MPIFHPRTRLVNFRLSEEEYLWLKEHSLRSGARSVSDYARAAVLSSHRPQGDCLARWERLENCMSRIESGLSSLAGKEASALHG